MSGRKISPVCVCVYATGAGVYVLEWERKGEKEKTG